MSNIDVVCGLEGFLRKDLINKFIFYNWCVRYLIGVFGVSCLVK